MSLIRRKPLRDLALSVGRTYRPAAGFSRVSASFYETAEAQLRAWVADYVKRLPSVGKTIT